MENEFNLAVLHHNSGNFQERDMDGSGKSL